MSLLDEAAPEARAAPEPLRRNRDFLLLWSGAGLSALGLRASVVAYPLLMIFFGNSPTGAGVVGFAALLPQLVVQLPAGALIDRWDRRRLLVLCDLAGLLAMAGVTAMLLAGRLWLPVVAAAAFVDGTAGLCYRLAERAAISHVVHPSQLNSALGQNEARGQAAGLLGQPAGSGLFQFGRWLPFAFTAVTHLVALCTLLLIRRDLQGERNAPAASLRAEVGEGLRWVWGQRFMRVAVGLLAGSNLLFQILTLTFALVVKENHGSPFQIGMIGLVAGAGGIAGALAGSRAAGRASPRAVLAGALALWAALMAPVAFVSHPYVLGALLGGMSFAGALMNVVAGVHQVRITPAALQGRVTSVFALLGSGMASAGALAGGVLLASFGTHRTALAIAAAMGLLALVSLVSPALRETAGDAGPSVPDMARSEEI
ncbi:MFS transporter [Streptomyces xanthochromogenes]|uniref:MFS transporter n=1 Tax=Streptomyces xanthochromogenes TaxID=67384 RepID=UPI00167C2E9E|nr:MFS transporter [Streptomyces xanthochromogenes]GHB53534.1 MFS transporter [Streptomyces xanthochromogenes]